MDTEARVDDSTGSPPADGARTREEARAASHQSLRPRPPHSAVVAATARAVVVTGALFGILAFAPLESKADNLVERLLACLAVLAVVVTVQIITVARTPYPVLRAAEAVSVSLSFLLVAFASTYFAMAQASPGSFSEALSRVDAMYFTITVFATVGFGDVVAVSQPARVAATAQMVVNMMMIGVIARVLLGTVRQRRAALDRTDGSEG